MGNSLLTQSVAMDLNGTGTLVDVTSYVRGVDGISKTPVRTDQFRDAAASTFTFTLENYDGRFTPGNASSPYPVPPVERMAVCWSVGGQLRQGSILSIALADAVWSAVMITCDDMLGAASRNTLGNLASSAVLGASPYRFWPLNDAAGSGQAAEITGNGLPLAPTGGIAVTFGGSPSAVTLDNRAQLSSTAAGNSLASAPDTSIPSLSGSLGVVGCSITPNQANASNTFIGINGRSAFGFNVQLYLCVGTSGGQPAVAASITGSQFPTLLTSYVVAPVGVEGFWAAGFTWTPTGGVGTGTLTLYLNGTSVASTSGATNVVVPPISGNFTSLIQLNNAVESETLGHFWWAPSLVNEAAAGISTEAGRLALIDATTSQVTLATLPTDLSTAPVGAAATSGQSALDAINTIIRTEQGYIDCVTTGTSTAPTQTVRVRARNRPATVSYSFDAQLELSSEPDLVRDSTNLIWSDNVTGANGSSQVVTQPALQSRAGSNNSSDTVAVYQPSDLYEFGTDRLWRGQNVALRPTSITINNTTCPTDRSADLLAMVPGDRIQITNINSTATGFSTWDGWLLDKAQHHTTGPTGQDLFTLYLQPCQPATGIYDTDLYANGGNNTISTMLTNVATSMLCTSSDGVTLFETSAVNYYLLVDSEVVKVTACSAPVAGVQTLTITRAQFSTAAASHAVGTAPEVYADSTGRLNNAVFAF